jgi:hypothetical protein
VAIVLGLAATLGFARPARAQVAPVAPVTPVVPFVPVEVRARPSVETSFVADGETFQRCTGNCSFNAPLGRRYRVHASGEGVPEATSDVVFDRATRIEVVPGDTSARAVGLVIGIAGTIMAISAAVLIVGNGPLGNPKSDANTWGGYLMLGGLVATPIGWGLLGGYLRTRVSVVHPGPVGAHAAGTARFAVAPTRGGAFGAMTFDF